MGHDYRNRRSSALRLAIVAAALATSGCADSPGEGLGRESRTRVDAVEGGTFYVDAAGSDANSGLSKAAAWRTISKVNSFAFEPGDKILFKRGQRWDEVLRIGANGASGSAITVGAYGTGERPSIDGISTNDKAWHVYENLVVDPRDDYPDTAVVFWDSDHMTLRDAEVMNSKTTNIFVGPFDGFVLQRVLNHHAGEEHGLYLSGEGLEPSVTGGSRNPLIEDCEFHSNGWENSNPNRGGYGIQLNANGAYVENPVIRRNLIYNNQQGGINDIGSRNGVFSYNVIANNFNAGVYVGQSSDPAEARPSTNNRYYNNVVYNDEPFNWSDMFVIMGVSKGIEVKNSIFVAPSYSWVGVTGGGSADFDYNIYGGDVIVENGSGAGSNSRTADPMLVDPNSFDFSLQGASPAVDAGLDVGLASDLLSHSVPVGAAPDIGAYEYGGAPQGGCGSDSECDDGSFCNGVETCGSDGICVDGADPCQSGQTCDEGNDTCSVATAAACTVDADCTAVLPDNGDRYTACATPGSEYYWMCDPGLGSCCLTMDWGPVPEVRSDATCAADARYDHAVSHALHPTTGWDCLHAWYLEETSLGCSSDAECDDGSFCNGVETCGADGNCVDGADPCQSAETCQEDSDTCSTVVAGCAVDADCTAVLPDNGDRYTACATPGSEYYWMCDPGLGSCCLTMDWGPVPEVRSDATCAADARYDHAVSHALHPTTGWDCLHAWYVDAASSGCSSDAECDDGSFCNGVETCGADGNCVDGADPCQSAETCDEVHDTCSPAAIGCTADADCTALLPNNNGRWTGCYPPGSVHNYLCTAGGSCCVTERWAPVGRVGSQASCDADPDYVFAREHEYDGDWSCLHAWYLGDL